MLFRAFPRGKLRRFPWYFPRVNPWNSQTPPTFPPGKYLDFQVFHWVFPRGFPWNFTESFTPGFPPGKNPGWIYCPSFAVFTLGFPLVFPWVFPWVCTVPRVSPGFSPGCFQIPRLFPRGKAWHFQVFPWFSPWVFHQGERNHGQTHLP